MCWQGNGGQAAAPGYPCRRQQRCRKGRAPLVSLQPAGRQPSSSSSSPISVPSRAASLVQGLLSKAAGTVLGGCPGHCHHQGSSERGHPGDARPAPSAPGHPAAGRGVCAQEGKLPSLQLPRLCPCWVSRCCFSSPRCCPGCPLLPRGSGFRRCWGRGQGPAGCSRSRAAAAWVQAGSWGHEVIADGWRGKRLCPTRGASAEM